MGTAGTLRKLILAKPRGFCAGVERAIDVVNIALERFGRPLYVRKEIVHNQHVVSELRAKGVIFVDSLEEVPPGATVIFSAHGVSPDVRAEAEAKGLRVIDATCPLVTKVHTEAVRFAREHLSIILVGHEGHDEVIGTMGEAPEKIHLVGSADEVNALTLPDPSRVAVITQTTLSVDDTREVMEALRAKFPQLVLPPKEDICYATQNRQTSVKEIATRAQLILVIGSENSSNSQRLTEVSRSVGTPAYLIDDIGEIDPRWLEGVECVGITAGASAPEHLVREVIDYFRAMGVTEVEEVEAVREEVSFALPPELGVRPERARSSPTPASS